MFPSLFQGGRWLIYKDFEELPLTLNAKDIADVLGISKSYAYNLFYRKDFPTLTIGKRKIVRKDKFLLWLDEHEGGNIDA